MKQYLDSLKYTLENGVAKLDRTGTGTLSVLGLLERYDIRNKAVPAVTTRKIPLIGSVKEGLWYISGDTNLKGLIDLGVTFWNRWVIPGTEVWKDLSIGERLDRVLKLDETHVNEFHRVFDELVYQTEDGNWMFTDVQNTKPNAMTDLLDWMEMRDIPYKILIDGKLGEVYGHQWRYWDRYEIVSDDPAGDIISETLVNRGFKLVVADGDRFGADGVDPCHVYHRNTDQLLELIDGLRSNPAGRRHIISAWNPGALDSMALPPCHHNIQFDVKDKNLRELATVIEERGLLAKFSDYMEARYDYEGVDTERIAYNWRSAFSTMHPHISVVEDTRQFCKDNGVQTQWLSSMLTMRSSDQPVGKPLNIVWYSVFTHMVAQVVGMDTLEFVIVTADSHIYLDQIELVKEQLARDPLPQTTQVHLDPSIKDIRDFKPEHFTFTGYESHPHIPYPVAV